MAAPAALLVTVAGCGADEPLVAEGDRAAFRLAFSAAQDHILTLEACRAAGSLPRAAARSVEIRKARFDYLAREASRHRLRDDVRELGRRAKEVGSRDCRAVLGAQIGEFDRRAVETLDAIERVEGTT